MSTRRYYFDNVICRLITADGCGTLQNPVWATYDRNDIHDGLYCEVWIPDEPMVRPKCGKITNEIYIVIGSEELQKTILAQAIQKYGYYSKDWQR